MQSYKKYLTAVSTYAEKKIYRCVFLVYGHTNTKKMDTCFYQQMSIEKTIDKSEKMYYTYFIQFFTYILEM